MNVSLLREVTPHDSDVKRCETKERLLNNITFFHVVFILKAKKSAFRITLKEIKYAVNYRNVTFLMKRGRFRSLEYL